MPSPASISVHGSKSPASKRNLETRPISRGRGRDPSLQRGILFELQGEAGAASSQTAWAFRLLRNAETIQKLREGDPYWLTCPFQ